MQDLLLRKSIVRWWPWPYWPTFEKIKEVSIKLLLMHADEMGIDWQISQFLQDGNFGWWDCRGLEAVTMRGGGGGEEGVLWASMQHALWGCRIKKTSTSILNDNIVNKTWNSRIHSLTVVHNSGRVFRKLSKESLTSIFPHSAFRMEISQVCKAFSFPCWSFAAFKAHLSRFRACYIGIMLFWF